LTAACNYKCWRGNKKAQNLYRYRFYRNCID